MKKLLTILLAVAMIFVIVGCSSDTPATGGDATNTYQDGTYTAYSDAGARGYGMATVTIEDDAIVDVQVAEFNDFGEEKDSDYGYDAFHDAKEEMPGRFVEANSADVDVFTGATSSSNYWKQSVERALEMALVDTSDATYFEGVFHGVSDVDERGSRGIARVTIENDNIVDVELKETRMDDEEEVLKDEDYTFEQWHEALEEMPGRFVEANSADVDEYTGATSSSNKWQQAVERALEKAAK
ncbi:FMN-binding protein [Serpentinicella sp. ANB-PHB4]|uniref:FMN-binding protein n=1 Tax=Serpentinicella sp. ANB-PHB4 TaxID=3074076 RepID=UPI002867286E|nr:FMN-binding protein [Serpentinicella sp. ANB-PHB4]MDR5660068.1 FMN-binding protein [Serpentinicella sp. ANB-PHB4]